MMKYDTYKDSEIDWLGGVPSIWKVLRVKDITKKIGSGVTPKGGSEVYVDSGIPILRSQNVYDNGLRIEDVSFINEETHQKMKNSQLKPYDILINITGASIGRTCIVPENLPAANINQHIIFIRMKKSLIPYTSYYFKSNALKEYINLIQAGSSKEALNMGQTLSTPILLPPLNEQTTIANYLDTKTQAIDKKVSLLEKKIGYYQELRKSLINETVTKGLDKNVKLKNSGIDWIGQIPEHWEVKRFKDVVSKYTTGGTPSTSNNAFFNGDNVWICISDIKESKYVSKSSLMLTNDAIRDSNISKTPKGSLLYSFKLSIGKMAFTTVDCYTNEAILSIFPNKNIDLVYYYMMLPIFMLLAATENIYGAKMLNQKLIANALVLHPPKKEQEQIGLLLEQRTQKIDQVTTNLQTQVSTLKELRKTLINDVVTGKIKVTK